MLATWVGNRLWQEKYNYLWLNLSIKASIPIVPEITYEIYPLHDLFTGTHSRIRKACAFWDLRIFPVVAGLVTGSFFLAVLRTKKPSLTWCLFGWQSACVPSLFRNSTAHSELNKQRRPAIHIIYPTKMGLWAVFYLITPQCTSETAMHYFSLQHWGQVCHEWQS